MTVTIWFFFREPRTFPDVDGLERTFNFVALTLPVIFFAAGLFNV